MALKDRILQDNHRVFMNDQHFADEHTWDGRKFLCVVDEDEALKRKNNNVVDVSWDNNTMEKLLYVPFENWPGRPPKPNTMGYFDNVYMKILQVSSAGGMWAVLITTNMQKEAR